MRGWPNGTIVLIQSHFCTLTKFNLLKIPNKYSKKNLRWEKNEHRLVWYILLPVRYRVETYHSNLAFAGSRGKRWPSNLLTANASDVLSSDSLKHLDLMSPTAGPPVRSRILYG